MNIFFSERHKEILTGLFAIVIGCGGFLIGEISLRAISLQKFGTATADVEKSSFYYIDDATGLRLHRPSSSQGKMKINSLGFRGPEIVVPKPEGTIRIAFLGTSTTLDEYSSSNEKTWPHRTIEELNIMFPNCHFDYVNAGVPGFSIKSIYKYFTHFVSKADPDVTLIYAMDVNSNLKKYAINTNYEGKTKITSSWLATKSLLWNKIEKNLEIVKLQRAAFIEKGKLQINNTNDITQTYYQELTELVKLTQGFGTVGLITGGSRVSRQQTRAEQIEAVQTSLYFIPFVTVNGLLNAFEAFNKTIENVAKQQNAIFIGEHEKIPSDLHHYVNSINFTDAGSHLMSRRVSKILASSPQFLSVLNHKKGCIVD